MAGVVGSRWSVVGGAFGCFLTTVNRLPYNRTPPHSVILSVAKDLSSTSHKHDCRHLRQWAWYRYRFSNRWSVALARLAFASVSMLTATTDRSFDFAQDDG